MRLSSQQKFQNRSGITLLLVISLVVLFLLMGTTFMVISNDFYKAARRRARLTTNIVDSEAVLDECFYSLVRGPSLFDTNSPLRGHSILADQYGYGVVGQVANETPGGGGDTTPFVDVDGPFVTIFVSAAIINQAVATDPVPLRRVLAPTANLVLTTDPGYFDGFFNGRVLSITSGGLKGFSGRIIDSRLIVSTVGSPERLHRLALTVLDEGLPWTTNLSSPDQIVINGADFAGFGAGNLRDPDTADPSDPTKGALLFDQLSDPDVDNSEVLGLLSLRPNRIGVPAIGSPAAPSTIPVPASEQIFLNQTNYGFLADDQSPNEPYDAPDLQNMFLSGFDFKGDPIPSFHRDSLYASLNSSGGGPILTADQVQQITFKPVYVAGDQYSTANDAYFTQYLSPADAFEATGEWTGNNDVNDTDNLDVDTDGDGVKDSVWIDIGLPEQTTSFGQKFRPLVAYHVIDMDGRLNVNAHGSLAETELTADDIADPIGGRGTGYGVAEISLSSVTPTNAGFNALLQNRYGVDHLPGTDPNDTTVEYDSFSFSQNHLGYPEGQFTTETNPNTLIGGTFATGADFLGQFSLQSVTPFTMPELSLPINKRDPGNATSTDLSLGEAVAFSAGASISPYVTNFSVKGSTADQMFEATELETLLRSNDVDTTQFGGRLRALISPAKQRTSVTTHSFETNVPTTTRSLARKLVAYLNTTADAGGVTRPI